MENQDLIKEVTARAHSMAWAMHTMKRPAEEVRRDARQRRQERSLFDSFYRDLNLAQVALRGIMGAGTNRMNIYTVGAATQGLATYLRKRLPTCRK